MLSYLAGVSSHFSDPACQRRQFRRYLSCARDTLIDRIGRKRVRPPAAATASLPLGFPCGSNVVTSGRDHARRMEITTRYLASSTHDRRRRSNAHSLRRSIAAFVYRPCVGFRPRLATVHATAAVLHRRLRQLRLAALLLTLSLPGTISADPQCAS